MLKGLGPEGYVIRATRIGGKRAIVVASAGDSGALYGTFHLLRLLSIATPIQRLDVREKPRHQLRILNHWDNLDGSIERGYAGRSLWKWDELPATIDPRLHDYARANASIGLNGTVINSVNANPRSLTADYIAKAAAIADVFRPYGLKVYLSANFAAPVRIGGLTTADPHDPAVQQWWKDKAAEIYKAIPDFGGFTVKANSEGQPGPQDYKRTHADGANLLADAVKPHGGIVMWRAFVYDATVDPDRVKRAYKEFVPLDGTFRDNVFVQTKNGPLDFMPREPFHPQFGAMPKTPNMVELQITQEYLGWSNHLVYLAPMWKEFFDADTFVNGPGLDDRQDRRRHAAGAQAHRHRRRRQHRQRSQLERPPFRRRPTGMPSAGWPGTRRSTSEGIADEWIRATWSRTPETVKGDRDADARLARGVRELHDAARSPSPDRRRPLRGDAGEQRSAAAGLDRDLLPQGRRQGRRLRPHARRQRRRRSVRQADRRPVERSADDAARTLLLWFHHLPWDYKLASGQTLWQGIVAHYQKGAGQAAQMEKDWAALKGAVDDERHAAVAAKLAIQTKDAAAWRDKCLTYFAQFSKQPIAAATAPSAGQ